MLTLPVESTEYPQLLKDLPNPPKNLYIKGRYHPDVFEFCLAVVGSRKMSDYGKKVTQYLVSKLAAQGITIVSGFMYGIDAEAHRAALSVGGKTVAVMPCGIDLICPDFQQDLYKQILESGGLIVSEYPGDVDPKVWTFPSRNRIVAGLCQSTLVVEAGDKSGSLITAGIAKKLGRGVLTIPGSIFCPSIKGNWQLLGMGASMVVSGSEISKFYSGLRDRSNLLINPSNVNQYQTPPPKEKQLPYLDLLNPQEKAILQNLNNDYFSINQLYRKTKINISQLIPLITSLSMKGYIQQEGDKYYACKN